MRAVARSLGLPGIVGIALIVAAALLWRSDLAPLKERERALADRQERSGAPRSDAQDAAFVTPDERLKAYYAFFDRSAPATDALAHLHAIGLHLKIESGRADYRLERLRDTPLSAYTVTLPVAGSYAAIRTYIEHALDQLPHASLDSARFERRGTGSGVEATLTLTVFLVEP